MDVIDPQRVDSVCCCLLKLLICNNQSIVLLLVWVVIVKTEKNFLVCYVMSVCFHKMLLQLVLYELPPREDSGLWWPQVITKVLSL